ncbi:glycosyltransferase [Robiginitalea sp. M366]|uniref:glycosyltransferase n=1 Tax=Robiginitalea aestuariiviva TaxID=3036903 RepID=UPI00240E5370|nr:glycosyltransferase [Robiginitalea aestuariiviva]MDG1572730.1 glycosyltransferase [Robiginitalea aestuariiviva]
MRLLLIINSLGAGGAEKLVADMASIIRNKGIHVELLVLSKNQDMFLQKLLDDNISITYSPYPIYSPLNIFFIRKMIKAFDIVHAHLFPSQYWLSLSFSSKPTVVTEHCTYNKRRSNLLFWPIEQLTYMRYRKVITISEKAKETLSSWLKLRNSKYVVIENGIDLARFRDAKPKQIEGITDKTVKVIMVGRFNPTKDQPTAIKSLLHLPDHIHLLLVGDGHLRESCEKLAIELGLNKRVHFLGLRKDIPELLKSSDICLISSHSEGLSISSLECLASGKPLITSNVNGLKEINRDVGLLFEDENEQELASQILRLINDPELYKEVANRCAEKSLQYDITRTVNKHLEIYHDIA